MGIVELHPEYLASLARQFGFLGAFLGGISATLYITLMTFAEPSRLVRWSLGLSATAALAFIATAYFSVGVVANNHPNTPADFAGNSTGYLQIWMSLSFVVGIIALLAGIGVSGWISSKTVGVVTTTGALVATIPILLELI